MMRLMPLTFTMSSYEYPIINFIHFDRYRKGKKLNTEGSYFIADKGNPCEKLICSCQPYSLFLMVQF